MLFIAQSKILLRLHYEPSKVELETLQNELQYMDEESDEELEVNEIEKQGAITPPRKRYQNWLDRLDRSNQIKSNQIKFIAH
jgi:hypothetical protein